MSFELDSARNQILRLKAEVKREQKLRLDAEKAMRSARESKAARRVPAEKTVPAAELERAELLAKRYLSKLERAERRIKDLEFVPGPTLRRR